MCTESDFNARERRGLMLALWAVLLLLWCLPLGSSLWLDETVTWWMASGSLETLWQRGTEFSGGSPVPWLLPWASMKLFGQSEWALRLPSLLCMSGAVLVVAAIGRRLFDRGTGLLAAAAFAFHHVVHFEARNARAYALAMLCATLATLALLRWLERPSVLRACGYALCVALMLLAHFMFGGLLLVHGVWVFVLRGWRGARWTFIQLLLLALVSAVGAIPALNFMTGVSSRASGLMVSGVPYVEALLRELAPHATLATAVVGVILLGVFGEPRRDGAAPPMERSLLAALGLLFVLPPVLLFVLSRWTPLQVFLPRYGSWHAIGFALLLGWCWRQLAGHGPRLALFALLLLMGSGAFLTRSHFVNEWRGLSAAVNAELETHPRAPLLAHTGLIESLDAAFVRDPSSAEYLLAPFAVYPPPAGHAMKALTWNAHTADAQQLLEELAEWLEREHSAFVLVSRDTSEPGFWPFFRGRLGPLGWKDRRLPNVRGNMLAVVFEKSAR